ncbi:hypothetical protein SARC_01793 [Sphaeroforma arctica JP610]|uniref:Beta-1,4-galactosyltransferase 7 n=1 Tax=Sphaeroforma arctica JP610 TaxID=667725 RepID=A0A0L0GAU0_9EUKA|nr:hypothetical protein SARC_01793 [Sphaeroforma arctica JP610]KNC86034.1 hypothetical protein SARC_01793 [Sphaeroforma arctica JP610]|eukprot:XP_014159936.1 hypothetical protein SARC_01793 [Sphaeroforma arctica JP610]
MRFLYRLVLIVVLMIIISYVTIHEYNDDSEVVKPEEVVFAPSALNRLDDVARTCDVTSPIKWRERRLPGQHRLGIVVPYKNRMKELQTFVPHMEKFLKAQGVDHEYFITNQLDDWRFNRGSLLNIGAIMSGAFDCDYIALHDVDLLPNQIELNYRFPEKGPYHVAAPGLHPKYKFSKFLGGILIMSKANYMQINGFSNKFWGWGKEDDEFRRRILLQDLQIYRPPQLKSGQKSTFIHIHGEERERDTKRTGGQRKIFDTTDVTNGYNTTTWDDACINQITIANRQVNMVEVNLMCDKKETPWCEPGLPEDPLTPEELAKQAKQEAKKRKRRP